MHCFWNICPFPIQDDWYTLPFLHAYLFLFCMLVGVDGICLVISTFAIFPFTSDRRQIGAVTTKKKDLEIVELTICTKHPTHDYPYCNRLLVAIILSQLCLVSFLVVGVHKKLVLAWCKKGSKKAHPGTHNHLSKALSHNYFVSINVPRKKIFSQKQVPLGCFVWALCMPSTMQYYFWSFIFHIAFFSWWWIRILPIYFNV